MDKTEFEALLERYAQGKVSEPERQQLESWLTFGHFSGPELTAQQLDRKAAAMGRRLPLAKKTLHLWPAVGIAAAVLLVCFGIWMFGDFDAVRKDEITLAQDIDPGKDGATLTLADGRQIQISDALEGNIAAENGLIISKTKEGLIHYEIRNDAAAEDPSVPGATTKLSYNTLSTSRGQQAQVRLPDGSLVFLNAASSLKYPTHFARAEKREVFLTGEGYFEVAKVGREQGPGRKGKLSFIVNTGTQQVEVLGTHFNVNAYADQPAVKTTLLEGSVRVSPQGASPSAGEDKAILLTPNQQATLSKGQLQVTQVNAQDAVAWKDGVFLFEDERLEDIMQRIARWYDVDVKYGPGVDKNTLYGGGVSRYDKVSVVLEMLESTKNIHFKIEGRTIVVTR